MLSQIVAGGVKYILHDSAGEEFWKPVPSFLRVPFLFGDFALHHFTVINCTQEHNYMLSPVIHPSKWLKLGVVLGTLTLSVGQKPQRGR